MLRELRLEIQYPDKILAQYEGHQASIGFQEIQALFPFSLLPRLDEYPTEERERFMVYVGEHLFSVLFRSSTLDLYLRALADQRRTPNSALRIRLICNAMGYLTLPWEFIYDNRQAVFPATVSETPFVRTPASVAPGAALSSLSVCRVLLVGASPADREPVLQYQEEHRRIQELLLSEGHQVEVMAQATVRGLQTSLTRFQPHIVYIDAHGYVEDHVAGLMLEDRHHETSLIIGKELGMLLQLAKPRLVVLNACDTSKMLESEEQGVLAVSLLQAGVPAVIAMQHRIPDASGVVFGEALFRALLSGQFLERALQEARHALLVSGGINERHFSTPTLYLGCEEGGRLIESNLPEREATTSQVTRSPFLYLNSFSEADAQYFFGRTKAIEALTSRVATHRLLVVHGRSGVGKSSLLRAGMAQSSGARLYYSLCVRFIADPLRALEEAIERAIESWDVHHSPVYRHSSARFEPSFGRVSTTTLSAPQSRLEQQLLELQNLTGRTILLIFDQFEELFVLLTSEEQRRFLSVLHTLYAQAALKLRVVLVVREEFLGELDRLRDLFPSVLSNSYYVSALTLDEAREALVGPLNTLGISYEQTWVDAVLHDLGQHGIEPALLQIVASKLYQRCFVEQGQPITLEAYQAIGGTGGSLAQYLLDYLHRYAGPVQGEILRVLSCFISSAQTRQPGGTLEIAQRLAMPASTVEQHLLQLEQAHLVRRLEELEPEKEAVAGTRWELAHEILIEAIENTGLLNIRAEMLRLKRRYMMQVASSVVFVILLVLFGLYLQNRSLRLHVQMPYPSTWKLSLFRGQAACVSEPQAHAALHEEASISGDVWERELMPVGNYEVTLIDQATQKQWRFPFRSEPLGWEHIHLRALPERVEKAMPISMELLYIPAGKATLGDQQLGQVGFTMQGRTVEHDGFFISKYEVTRGQFLTYLQEQRASSSVAPESYVCKNIDNDGNEQELKVDYVHDKLEDFFQLQSGSKRAAAGFDQLPITCVNYHQMSDFLAWLTRRVNASLAKDGGMEVQFRLPREEEWELVARGMDQRMHAWGDCFTYRMSANLGNTGLNTEDDFLRLSPVGSFAAFASPYGAQDLIGNARELTETCYSNINQQGGLQPRPASSGEPCEFRAHRGGSYNSTPPRTLAVLTNVVSAEERSSVLGFRVVMEMRKS